MRIVLVGFMACGKTTVGDLLAKKLNKLQIDLDQAIVEREKLTIPEIFAKFGEDHFRLCEHRALLANIGKDAVITTGTGICAMSWNGPQPGNYPAGGFGQYRPAVFAAAGYRPGGLCGASRASRS